VLGLASGALCFFFCTTVKNALGYDDSLDVFGIHCVGGILGAIGTGILVNPALNGTGVVDYAMNNGAGGVAEYAFATQVWAQTKGVLVTIVWSGVMSAILYKLVDLVVGLRVTHEAEREGLDLADHGERAYNY
jgi:Amt family ammonium transporter